LPVSDLNARFLKHTSRTRPISPQDQTAKRDEAADDGQKAGGFISTKGKNQNGHGNHGTEHGTPKARDHALPEFSHRPVPEHLKTDAPTKTQFPQLIGDSDSTYKTPISHPPRAAIAPRSAPGKSAVPALHARPSLILEKPPACTPDRQSIPAGAAAWDKRHCSRRLLGQVVSQFVALRHANHILMEYML